jgi:exodeoxyribonuclease V alpha subunit
MIREDNLLQKLDELAETSELRRLSVVFSRFVATLGDSSPALILACTILTELEGKGNSCLDLADLGNPCKLLEWSEDTWFTLRHAAGPLPANTGDWQYVLSQHPQIWTVGTPDRQQPLVLVGSRLYLRRYWRDEKTVANTIKARALIEKEVDPVTVRTWIDRLFPSTGDANVNWQKIACAIAAGSPLSIITGGPGTGKTYTAARLLALQFVLAKNPDQLRVVLAAPTGKAAARLKQSIDGALGGLADEVGAVLPLTELTTRIGAAKTLHSLLGARPDTRAFRHHAGNLLDVDVLIVDEASMVHLEMMAALLEALPLHATLVVPAVLLGAGSPLAQQTVMLRKSWRFDGPIGALALAINAGQVAEASALLRRGENRILDWRENAGQSVLLQIALDGREGAAGGYRDYLKLITAQPTSPSTAEHGQWVHGILTAFEGFRILCAIRDGEWGVEGINIAIALHLEHKGLIQRRGEWYVGRPVIVTRNDYSLGVFNGDVGITLPDPVRPASLRVYFLQGEGVRSVLASRLTSVEAAFAMTVHKSQGSEFRHTVMVLPQQAGPVIVRELIYTGITRASKQFTLISPVAGIFEEALARKTRRTSGLRDFLAQAANV